MFVFRPSGKSFARLATLTFSRIQTREGRWGLADLVGKRAMDEWTSAAESHYGSIFRRMLKGGHLLDQPLRAWAVWDVGAIGRDHKY